MFTLKWYLLPWTCVQFDTESKTTILVWDRFLTGWEETGPDASYQVQHLYYRNKIWIKIAVTKRRSIPLNSEVSYTGFHSGAQLGWQQWQCRDGFWVPLRSPEFQGVSFGVLGERNSTSKTRKKLFLAPGGSKFEGWRICVNSVLKEKSEERRKKENRRNKETDRIMGKKM